MTESLDLSLGRLEFFAPDTARFPAIRLAYEALRAGAAGWLSKDADAEIGARTIPRGLHPNTVPDAPEPNPAPASAPLPRCSSTRKMIEAADTSCTAVKTRVNHIGTPTQPEPAAARIARNSSAFSEAPPINPPSTSGIANSSAALPAFTLPP